MSYILKALARSERERQRLRSPDLRDVLDSPDAPPRHRRSGLFLFLFLSANTLLLAAILFLRDGGSDPQALQVSPGANQPAPVSPTNGTGGPSAPEVGPADAPAPVPETVARTEPAPRVAPSTRPLLLEAQPRAARSAPGPSVPAATAPGPRPAPAEPEPDDEIAGIERVESLPGIEITVHVYADEPQQRFAYVNGIRYVEGETLRSGGGRLERITQEGIIVDLGARRAHLLVRR